MYESSQINGWVMCAKGTPRPHKTQDIKLLKQKQVSIEEILRVVKGDFKIFLNPRQEMFESVLDSMHGVFMQLEHVSWKYTQNFNLHSDSIVIYPSNEFDLWNLMTKLMILPEEFGCKNKRPIFCTKFSDMIYFREGIVVYVLLLFCILKKVKI